MALSPPPVPRVARSATTGMVVCGLAGAIVGLVLGLRAHPATAWFAMIEVGLPAAIVGTFFGAVAGGIASVLHRLRGTELEQPRDPRV